MPTSIIAHETEVEVLNSLSNQSKKIFVVGIFSSVLKDNYKTKSSYVVPGEPEEFFLKLKYEKSNLDSFFENKNKEISSNNLVENLDDLPFPDWDYYSKKYPLKNNFLGFNSKTAIPMLASRGCPYSCFNYCTYPLQQGRKVRARSVENLIKEIRHWQSNIGSSKFVFRDPVFSINRKHTIELCEEIILRRAAKLRSYWLLFPSFTKLHKEAQERKKYQLFEIALGSDIGTDIWKYATLETRKKKREKMN